MLVFGRDWKIGTHTFIILTAVLEIVCKDFPSRYTGERMMSIPVDPNHRSQCCKKFPTASNENPFSAHDDKELILGYWEKFPCPPPWAQGKLLEKVNWSCIGPHWRDVKFHLARRCNIDIPGANLVKATVLSSLSCGHSCKLVIVCICCSAVGVAVIVLACVLYKKQPEIYSVTGSPTHQTALNATSNKLYSEQVEQETKLQQPPCQERMSRTMCRSRDSLGMLHNHYASEDSMRAANGGPYSCGPYGAREENGLYKKQRPSTPDIFLHVSPTRSSYEKLSEEDTPSPCSTDDPPIYEYIDNEVYPPRVIAPSPRRGHNSVPSQRPREIISAYEIPICRPRGHTDPHRSHSYGGILVPPPPAPPPPPIRMAESWTQTLGAPELFDMEEMDRRPHHIRPPHRTRRGKRRRQTSSSFSETESDTTSSSLNQ
ncbi:uncharacterized protein LOC135467817 isoform X2 [Liolophura sinensis]|uniref:uncharacterized protein LOC135467817 isoform X2 n=1 Tax=Liolophura sinensis TaxID=3198878 RepID=UPI003158B6EE